MKICALIAVLALIAGGLRAADIEASVIGTTITYTIPPVVITEEIARKVQPITNLAAAQTARAAALRALKKDAKTDEAKAQLEAEAVTADAKAVRLSGQADRKATLEGLTKMRNLIDAKRLAVMKSVADIDQQIERETARLAQLQAAKANPPDLSKLKIEAAGAVTALPDELKVVPK